MKPFFKCITTVAIFCYSNAQAQNSFKATGFNHVESVGYNGKYIYAADIGKELNPTAKDGDGKIIKLDFKGKIIDSTFSKEPLNAPKGIAIANGVLFTTDIDRLVALSAKSGKKLYEIQFDGVSFLNDIAVADKNTLYISCTDKNTIFKVDLSTRSYSDLHIDKPIAGANGLFYDKTSKGLYVNGMGSDNKPNGKVGFVDLSSNKFNQLSAIEGIFDGIGLKGEVLYTSNWVVFDKKGIIQAIDLKSGEVTIVSLEEPIAGPADFIIVKDQIVIPEMMTGSILFITLK